MEKRRNSKGGKAISWRLAALVAIAAATWSFGNSNKALAYTITDDNFKVETGDYGEISSLKINNDSFDTNYVMNKDNSPKQNTDDHEWFGELMFTYKLGSGNWQKVSTNKSADVRTQSQDGNTINVNYNKNSSNAEGIKNFSLNESYSLKDGQLYWSIKLKNTSQSNIEFGDIGLPMPFNERWPGDEEIYENRVVYHSFTGYNNSYITAQRPSGVGPYILLTPDSSTDASLEYQDHWVTQEHPNSTWAQDQGDWSNGLNVFYIKSNVIKSTNRGYLQNSSLILKPNEEKVYTFKVSKVKDENNKKETLYNEGLIDVTSIPGMMFATNMKGKIDLHTSEEIKSITAKYPSETTISYSNTANGNHKIYNVQFNHLGQNDITVEYGSGKKTVLQFYAIEPIDKAIQRHSTFMVDKTQWNNSSLGYNKVFDDWMMDTKAKRGEFYGYWGWGDDWGLTHGQFLAEKNVLNPVSSEIKAVDEYLETAIWNTLMKNNHSDYLVHDFYKAEPNDTPTYRGYAYAHVYNTYFSMYKIAKLHPNATTYINDAKTYLLRAYNIFKTLYDGPVAYNWNTGLMGELTTPEIIKDLQSEGLTTEANDVIKKMGTKYNNFKGTKYPYGSEYTYDNTGEEACYTLAKMNNNIPMMGKINEKTKACRGTAPVWYYYADPVTICGENWWNFQYTTSLAGYIMDDWIKTNSNNPELEERLSYAAKIANIGCINSGQIDSDPANIGAVSWTYQAEKGNWGGQGVGGGNLHNGWRQMSGEADLGLFGAIKILSSDVAIDPIFGLYGYGCDVTQNGDKYEVTPKDGIFKRLNLITQKASMELEKDQYTKAIAGTNKDYLELDLKNTEGNAHTTKLTLSGLVSGEYKVLVNDSEAGSLTAKDGQKSSVDLKVDNVSSCNVKIVLKNRTTPGNQSENIALKGTPSTSFCSSWEDVTAINDGYDPTSSSDRSHKVYGNWDNAGTTQWLEYDFADNYTISSSDVYWFDDNQGIDLPASCSMQYWNGTSWVNISDAKGLGVEGNKYNTTTFSPITTNKIRLNMTAKSGSSTGVLEWKVNGFKSEATNIAANGTPTTSFCSSWEDVTALNDGFDPVSSSDRSHKVYGNWSNAGTTQWVEYDFQNSYTLNGSDVYWFDDNQGIDLPASSSIQYWNGSSWVDVPDVKGLGVEGNKYNTTTFKPIKTNKIRLNMTGKPGYSTGVLEWKVYGYN